jgi:CBS domain containing-hemolysin-like protein
MLTTLLVFLAVSLVISFFCSLWESVLLSITPSYMQIKLNEGGKIGPILKSFKENIDKPLAGILTMNTIAQTFGAVGIGMEAIKIWENSNPLITGLLVPALTTASILIFSEIIPKTIGATNWKSLAPFTVKSLNILLVVLSPIIWLCQLITGFFNSNKEQSVFSRIDFLAMAQIGSDEGVLDKAESKFIHNLLHFKNFKVKDVMTPRVVTVSAPQTMSVREFYDIQDDLVFSRIPIRQSEDDEMIIGYVLKDHMLEHLIDDEKDRPLSDFKRDIMSVPEDYGIFNLFNDFIQKREHIALVINEYDTMSGIVTMEDVIETLLGAEIVDETDKIVDLQDMAKKQWRNRYKRNSLQEKFLKQNS